MTLITGEFASESDLIALAADVLDRYTREQGVQLTHEQRTNLPSEIGYTAFSIVADHEMANRSVTDPAYRTGAVLAAMTVPLYREGLPAVALTV
jgi:hypothetical protein